MKSHLAKVSLALLSAAFLLGCQEQGSGPVGPGPEFDKPTNACDAPVNGHCHGGDNDDTEVTWSLAHLTGHGVLVINASTLVSTCSGTPGSKPSNPTVEWKDGNEDDSNDENENEHCVTVTPTKGTLLGNDAVLIVATKKGSTTFTLQFLIQDFGGLDGTQYRTDRFLALGNNTEFTGVGFTLHVHSTVDIYKLKGHTGGPKVENVGTIDIGDIVYR